MSSSLLRATLFFALIGILLGAQPRYARADPSQLCRAFSSITLAPTDILFAPYISGRDAYGALSEEGHPYKVWVSFLPSYPVFIVIQVGGTVIRIVAGVFEILPGLVSLFAEEAGQPLFAQQDQAPQIYRSELGPCPVRIGTSYWSVLSGSEPRSPDSELPQTTE